MVKSAAAFLIALKLIPSPAIAEKVEADFSVMPARATGKLIYDHDGDRIEECVSINVGPRDVLFPSHCARYDSKHLTVYLHYKNNVRLEGGTKITEILMSGGGYNPQEGLFGRDWILARTETEVGTKHGYLPLYNGDLPDGTKIKLTSYGKSWNHGEIAYTEECVVKPPPQQLKKFCDELPDGQTSCNFFSHDCAVDADGFGSGGPITAFLDGKEQLVGMQAKQAVVSNVALTGGGVGARLFNLALTVNEAAAPSANIFFHVANVLNLEKLEALSSRLKGRDFRSDTVDHGASAGNPPLVRHLDQWLDSWPNYTTSEKISEVQKFNTTEGQRALSLLLDRYSSQLADPSDGKLQRFVVEVGPVAHVRPHTSRLVYGRYYWRGEPTTNLPLEVGPHPRIRELQKEQRLEENK